MEKSKKGDKRATLSPITTTKTLEPPMKVDEVSETT